MGCKCMACFCVESGCACCCDPICLQSSKCCCCVSQWDSGADCCGSKGMCASLNKCLCCVSSCSSTPACGVCNTWCCGHPYGKGSGVVQGEDQWVRDVFWLYYCIFCGNGCANACPVIHSYCKFLCCESDTRTTGCCNGGCCHGGGKSCCGVQRVECPPNCNIGMAICGCQFCCCFASGEVPRKREQPPARKIGRTSKPQQMEMS